MLISERAQKCVLAGVLVWLPFGLVLPAFFIYAAFHSKMLHSGFHVFTSVLGVCVGVATLASLLIHPRRRNWALPTVALLWFCSWGIWLSVMGVGLAAVRARAAAPPNGAIIPISSGVALGLLLIPISSIASAVLLFAVTRSWRVLVAVLFATALFALVFISGGAASWTGLYLWHPIVVGAMIAWGVSHRLHAYPSHACQVCGYDLRGLEIGTKCPECGKGRVPL